MKKKKQEQKMYKHSLGHYWTQQEAMKVRDILQKQEIYNNKLHVVEEERALNKYKKWCVCEFYPEKGKKTNKK
jgi:hypothetical protein